LLDVKKLRKDLDNYLDVYCQEYTRRTYRQLFERLEAVSPGLLESMDRPTDSDIRAYLAELKRQAGPGEHESLMRLHFYFLKTLCEKIAKGRWPIPPSEAPPEPDTYRQPTIPPATIAEMIQRMKLCSNAQARTRFFVSTIYGARRIEIGEMAADSLDLAKGTLLIRTKKHGETRLHCLPDRFPELGLKVAHLLDPADIYPLSGGQMTHLFNKIARFCLGRDFPQGVGFHSIRRQLATCLDNAGANPDDIYTFMRWKRPKTILDRYIVRTATEVDAKLAAVDLRIFKVHPFLKYWGENS